MSIDVIQSQPIWPSLEDMIARLKAGEPIELPAWAPEEKSGPDSQRTIEATWIEDLLGRTENTVQVPVVVVRGIIVGPLSLRYIVMSRNFSFRDCIFQNAVDFSFSEFQKEARFDACVFTESVKFVGVTAKAGLEWDSAEFRGDLFAEHLTISNYLSASGARFASVRFDGLSCDGDVEFSGKSGTVEFLGPLEFINADVRGQLIFTNAHFHKTTNFDLTRVGAGAYFGDSEQNLPVIFDGDASFIGASIKGNAYFVKAIFNSMV